MGIAILSIAILKTLCVEALVGSIRCLGNAKNDVACKEFAGVKVRAMSWHVRNSLV